MSDHPMPPDDPQAPTVPHYADDSVTLWHGDCLDVLRTLPDNSVDSVVTDPPYGLEFMGKAWDSFGKDTSNGYREAPRINDRSGEGFPGHRGAAVNSFQAGAPFQRWCEQWAAECLRVLKPGGHLLAFGGTRTWHRLACAVEDAGFEVRDSIAWLYGSGFPKSLDVSKAIDKAGGWERPDNGFSSTSTTCPAFPNPCPGHPTANGSLGGGVMRHARPSAPASDAARTWQGWGTALKPAFEPVVVARKPLAGTVAANVLTHGTGALNIDGCRVAGNVPHTQGGITSGGIMAGSVEGARREPFVPAPAGRWPANVVLSDDQAAELDRQSGTSRDGVAVNRNRGDLRPQTVAGAPARVLHEDQGYGGEGGASRFFPTFRYEAKAPTVERPRDGETAHPTVKPLDLMRWLVRLVTPPGGTVLEPFAGSGTTAEACVIEGFRCIAIEREASYLPLIVQRLSKPIALDLFGGETA